MASGELIGSLSGSARFTSLLTHYGTTLDFGRESAILIAWCPWLHNWVLVLGTFRRVCAIPRAVFLCPDGPFLKSVL
jgi:hypothetical protein